MDLNSVFIVFFSISNTSQVKWGSARPQTVNDSELFERYAANVSRTQCFMNIGESPEPVLMQSGAYRQILDVNWYQSLSPTGAAMNHDQLLEHQDQQVLDALKEAVAEALERERQLGQYAVV